MGHSLVAPHRLLSHGLLHTSQAFAHESMLKSILLRSCHPDVLADPTRHSCGLDSLNWNPCRKQMTVPVMLRPDASWSYAFVLADE